MGLGGGKGAKAPAAPDYSAIAAADEKAADLNYQLGQDQLTFYKDQYNTYLPYVKDYLAAETDTTDENRDRANQYYDFYKDTYRPLESSFAQTAANYLTPQRTTQNRGLALTDVANQYSGKRQAALSSLESYGIDPSQTRYGALDLSSRVAEAGAAAAAGTQSALNTEKIGLGLEGEAIKTGRGYAPDISSAYNVATDAGSKGTGSATNLYSASGSAMGTPTSYFNSGNTAYSNEATAQNYGYTNALDSANFNYKSSSDTWKGIGSLAGGALGFFL